MTKLKLSITTPLVALFGVLLNILAVTAEDFNAWFLAITGTVTTTVTLIIFLKKNWSKLIPRSVDDWNKIKEWLKNLIPQANNDIKYEGLEKAGPKKKTDVLSKVEKYCENAKIPYFKYKDQASRYIDDTVERHNKWSGKKQ